MAHWTETDVIVWLLVLTSGFSLFGLNFVVKFQMNVVFKNTEATSGCEHFVGFLREWQRMNDHEIQKQTMTSDVGVASSLAPPIWHFLMQTQSVLICHDQNNLKKKSQIFVLYFHLSADLFSFSSSWFVWMRNVPRNNPFNLIEVHKGLQVSEFIVSFSQRPDFPHVQVLRLLLETCIKQMQWVKKTMDHMT